MSVRSVESLVLEVVALRKEFRFYPHPWDRLLEWVSGGRLQRGQPFVALDQVSFGVSRGEAVGIIGANGAGKSTLLKILCGTLYPTSGQVVVHGRIAPLLELGTGFHPDFTGRQNIIFNARFLGLGDEEIHERMAAILAFSELGEFIDRPLRTYSSGMYVRLAFAVMAHVNPQLLIIDEALSVGDAYFQQKCIRRIRQFRDEGATLLFVSHDSTAVKTLCSRALLLHHGRVVDMGSPDEVLARYNTLIAREAGSREILQLEAQHGQSEASASQRAGSFAAIIENVRLQDAQGQECRSFIAGEEASITVCGVCLETIVDPTVGVLIRDRLGNDIYGTNTYHQQVTTGQYDFGEQIEVTFRLALNLGPGEYTLTTAMHTLDVHVHDSFDWIERALVFRILPPPEHGFIGAAFLRPQITYRRQGAQSRGCEQWAEVLSQVFGEDFPRQVGMGEQATRWRFSGWYAPEGENGNAYCWTKPKFSLLLDLRGEYLVMELSQSRPASLAVPLRISASLFDQPLGAFVVEDATRDALVCLPLPPSARPAQGLVCMEVEGWRPAEAGVEMDQRILGLCVRRVWVAEVQPDRWVRVS